MESLQTDLFYNENELNDFFSSEGDKENKSALYGYENAEDEEIQSVYRTIINQWSPKKNANEPLIISHPLPSCGDESRFLPWVLARSNIFTSLADKDFGKLVESTQDKSITYLDPKTIAAGKNKKGGAALSRPWRFESEVALWGNGNIHATGPVLGQTDLKVLLQLLWLGRANGKPGDSDFNSHPHEGYIRFDLNQLCRMLGKKDTYKDRQRIKEALYCMTKVTLSIEYNNNHFNGALISEFLQCADGERCIVKVPKSITKLFMPIKISTVSSPNLTSEKAGSYSKMPSRYLSTVRSARASWLINFLISHNLEKFNAFSEKELFNTMGVNIDEISPATLRGLRHRLKKDFNDLITIGVISNCRYDPKGARYHVSTAKNTKSAN